MSRTTEMRSWQRKQKTEDFSLGKQALAWAEGAGYFEEYQSGKFYFLAKGV